MADPDSLDRFVQAQAGSYAAAREEIAAGRKQSHWMWFVYPQLRGLGRSSTAEFYGIADLDEAARYLDHPLLGSRLVEMCDLILTHAGRDPARILGATDSMKLRSCATLFAAVPDAPDVFDRVIDTFYAGARCPRTLDALAGR